MADVTGEKGAGLVAAIPFTPTREGSNITPGVGKFNPYPPAQATFEGVVANPKLFMETLEKLHSLMGTKFMVPIVGGKELNLHRLFIEVTNRGGIEQVIRNKRWKEITSVFNFPPTATNASFVLRKYYASLLNHYEQIYFFRSTGWNSPSPVPFSIAANQVQTEKSIEPMMSPLECQARRKRGASEILPAASLFLPKNYPVVGVIDGKFENGYLVSVQVGARKLQGVLYHAFENSAAQIPHNANNLLSGSRRRRRRRKLSKLDPTHPKPNRSGYNFFFAEQHARLKPLYPGKDREISKIIGDLWNKLTETEKAVYQEIGLKDKERYQSEMVVYRERQKTGQAINTTMPIQQKPVETDEVLRQGDVKINMEEGNLISSPQSESTATESDSELESSAGGENDVDLASMPEELPTESDDFELRKRENDIAGPSQVVELKKED